MASKWWRYNSTTHIFEQSVNEGDNWTVPPLNASIITEGVFDPARLGGSLAYTNAANTFSQKQTLNAGAAISGDFNVYGPGSGTDFTTAPIEIQTTFTPRISFHWPGVVASQLGMDSAGNIRTYDNPGTGYAPFIASTIQSTSGVYIGNIQSQTGLIYPGNIAVGGYPAQASWYIAGHSSFGLYSNTGLYVESALWCNQVVPRQGVFFPSTQVQVADANTQDDYEEGTFTPMFTGVTGSYSVAQGVYTKIGNTVIFSGRAAISGKSGVGGVTVTLPFVQTPGTVGQAFSGAGFGHWGGYAINIASCWGAIWPGEAQFRVYHIPAAGGTTYTWSAGGHFGTTVDFSFWGVLLTA